MHLVAGSKRMGLLRVAAILAFLVALGVVVWLGAFHWPEPVEPGAPAATAAENSSKRTATLAILAGVIALGGLIVSVSNYRRQAKHDAHVHEKDRQDLVHQRYAMAIEHLGATSPAAQAAAIYALEDVIEADPDRRATIVQTLVGLMAAVRAELEQQAGETAKARPDVRMIAGQVVIARHKGEFGAPPAWLVDADLRSFRLADADLSFADLSGADLTRADLRRANLENADLRGAQLESVMAADSRLGGANLAGCRVGESSFRGAELFATAWHDARGTAVDFRGANLIGAVLQRVNLPLADLSDADMQGAVLAQADFGGSSFEGARLDGAKVTEVDFSGASIGDVASWKDARVWSVAGLPDRWCPPGATRERPEAWSSRD